MAEHQTSLLALQAKIGQHTLWEPPTPRSGQVPQVYVFPGHSVLLLVP